MKAVLLAGGLGTRISEESHLKPKPMIEIGGKPILWHIMKMYANHGVTEFIVCAGYKGYLIKEYFANYFLHNSDITFDLKTNEQIVHQTSADSWKVTVVDTGEETMTGGRLKRIRKFIGDEPFCLTYGDGVSDIDIRASIAFHKNHGKLATISAVQPPGRFGRLQINGTVVESFVEKPVGDGDFINGGFFVLSPKVLDFIENDETLWEKEPLATLANNGQLESFIHHGFWQPMDTQRDRTYLESLWQSNQAPWKSWK